MENQVPALPLKASIDKQGKLVINYGKYQCKFKPLDYSAETKEYSGLLITKFLWDTTKEMWEPATRKEHDKDKVKQLLGVDDETADNVILQIHNDLFGEQ